ncbi:S-layer homology domain-containing protein [Chakrabartyella piscis]|uniref:S-layer homology domain-containing protein n=1 Tax=Chakrabartyella piscis TaxID=2918914 RepID=UPI0029589C9F|nr:S-layer homology domain-containing protein [Chakrabartyella piscis]
MAKDNTITVVGEYTGESGITYAEGTGHVGTGNTDWYKVWDAEKLHFTSDNINYYLVKDGDTETDLHLMEAIVKLGEPQEETYTTAGIDLTDIIKAMFDIETVNMDDFNVVADTGVGALGEDDKLYVETIGDFTISYKDLQRDAETERPYIEEATLTINPKEITISDITCIERGPDNGSLWVDLNDGSGTLTGVEGDDSVSIYFDDAYGLIDTDGFDSGSNLTSYLVSGSDYDGETTGDGVYTFLVNVESLKLTGTDAVNYVLGNEPTSTVTINIAIPYIAWPTAEEVVWGNDRSNDDFYGGKVIVLYNGVYTDISNYGGFEWVDATSKAGRDAGTYTDTVHFVEDTTRDGYDATATYHATLQNMTQEITQIVEPAAVTFTIANNTIALDSGDTPSVSAIDANGNPVTAIKLYYATGGEWDWEGNVPAFDTVGTYLVGAELTSNNYRHAGTVVTSAKQIGAVVVYDGELEEVPATYTVTFSVNGEIDESLTITGALSGDVHVLPTLDTELYSGWSYNGITYDLNGRFTQPASDVTLTAVAAADKSQSVSGTITGTDLDGSSGTLSGIAVGLWQGSDLVGSLTTGDDGEYSFDVVPGMYNLVITRDMGIRCEITKYVDVTSSDYNMNFILPDVLQNAVLTIEKGLPAMAVEGLTLLAASFTDGGTEDSEVTLDITEDDAKLDGSISDEAQDIVDAAVVDGLDSNNVKLFFNIDITAKTGNDTSYSAVHELDNCLTFYVPLTGIYQGHKNYYVYRNHEGEVQELLETPNAEGEYFEVVDNVLVIHARYFSLYALGYDDVTSSSSSSSGGTNIYPPILDAGDGGSLGGISISNPTNGNVVKFYVSTEDGYELESLVITDDDGNEYEITKIGNGWYSYVQPATIVTITARFDDGDSDSDDDAEEGFLSLNKEDHFAYMVGYPDDTFGPNQNITRAETVVMFARLLSESIDLDKTYDTTFWDVKETDWFANHVGFMEQYGIISGYEDGSFGGNKPITRAEFAAIASRFDALVETEGSIFSDVLESSWSAPYINSAAEKGWISGYPDGTFQPQQSITRAESVTLVNNMLERVCDEAFALEHLEELTTFVDTAETHWAYYQVMEATNGHDYEKDADGNETWTNLR